MRGKAFGVSVRDLLRSQRDGPTLRRRGHPLISNLMFGPEHQIAQKQRFLGEFSRLTPISFQI
jgi:hypothetical protein